MSSNQCPTKYWERVSSGTNTVVFVNTSGFKEKQSFNDRFIRGQCSYQYNVLLEVDILFYRLINKKILENRKNVILENIDETSVLFLLWFLKSTSSLDGIASWFWNEKVFSYTVRPLIKDTVGLFHSDKDTIWNFLKKETPIAERKPLSRINTMFFDPLTFMFT